MTSDRPVRGFLGVEWRNKKGERWTVYAVHLKSNRGGREASSKRRERAIEYLRMDWRKRGLNPDHDAILIAGDFNCSLKNPMFKKEKTIRGLLAEGWKSVTQEMPWPKGATVLPNEERGYPSADFDHILLSPGWKRRIGSNRIVAGVDQGADVPSDHWPVWMKW
jgi:endonuclease/exonuclease/phosphatase family metal-dependent hydrolase